MESQQTFYDILGVDRDASEKEIREAYLRIAKQHHPDAKSAEEIEALEIQERDLSQTRIFKMVTFAYQTLKDPEMRRKYDQTLGPSLKDWDESTKDSLEEMLSMADLKTRNRAFGRLSNFAQSEGSHEGYPGEPRRVSLFTRFLRFIGLQ